jgi:hypothetical protein
MACKSPSRKLTDADVRSIFECLHHKAPIPQNLKFTIVPVGPSGQKFSPPSHEFEGTVHLCTHTDGSMDTTAISTNMFPLSRRSLRSSKGSQEAEGQVESLLTSSSTGTPGPPCLEGRPARELSLESLRPSVLSPNRYTTTVLLPQGSPRLQSHQRRCALDHVQCRRQGR